MTILIILFLLILYDYRMKTTGVKMRKFLYLFLIVAGSAQFATAESLVLTEEQSVKMALEQNLDLKASQLDLEMSEDQNNNSWNVLLPDFSIGGGISRTGSLLNDSSGSSAWAVSGSLAASLSLNASSFFTMDYYRLSFEAQELMYQMDEDQLKVNVKNQFYYLLAYKENLELERKNLELASKRWAQTETNYQNGLASELEVLEAKNTYESMRPSYTDTKTSYETQLMSFKSLLGLSLEQAIELDGRLEPVILDLDAGALVNNFMLKRSDIQSSLKSIEVQENLASIEALDDRSPSLTLSADWSSSAADLGNIDFSDSASFSAYINMPLNGFIPGSSESLDISEAETAVEQARLSYQDTVDSAEQEIRTLVMQLEGYRENIEITEESVLLAQRTYEMTEDAYNTGTKELLYLEEAQNTLFSAQQDLLLSRYNYMSGFLDLEYALNATSDEIKTFSE